MEAASVTIGLIIAVSYKNKSREHTRFRYLYVMYRHEVIERFCPSANICC